MSQLFLSYVFFVIFNMTFFLFFSCIPYVARDLKMDELHMAYSQTFFNLLLLCGTTLSGSILNKFGYKRVLSLPFISVGFSSLILLNATSPLMILMAQCFGVLMATQQILQLAVAQMTKPGGERTTAFSRLGLCFGIGFLFTPVLSKISTMLGGERGPLMASRKIDVLDGTPGSNQKNLSSLVLSVPHVECFQEKMKTDKRIPRRNYDIEEAHSIKFPDPTEKSEFRCSVVSFGTLPFIFLLIENLKTNEQAKEDEDKKAGTSKSLSGLELLRHDSNLRLLFVLKILLIAPGFMVFGSIGIYLMSKFNITQTTNSLVQLDVGVSIMFSNSIGISILRKRYTEHQLIWIGAFVCSSGACFQRLDRNLFFRGGGRPLSGRRFILEKIWTIICYTQFVFFEYLFQIWFMLFFIIYAITIAGNSADSLISSSSTHEQQGIILGLSNSVISAVRTSAPTFGIWMSKNYGFGSLGLIGVVASVVSVFLLYSNKSFGAENPQEKKEVKSE